MVNADKVDGKDEVLGAGNIVIRQLGVWTEQGGGTGLVIQNWAHTSTVERASAGGFGPLLMSLQEPGTIDGQAYGFQSVQVCFHSSTNATVTNTTVAQNGAGLIVEDGTIRPLIFPDCYTISDPTPTAAIGGTRLYLNLSFSAAGEAEIGNIVTTWVPIP